MRSIKETCTRSSSRHRPPYVSPRNIFTNVLVELGHALALVGRMPGSRAGRCQCTHSALRWLCETSCRFHGPGTERVCAHDDQGKRVPPQPWWAEVSRDRAQMCRSGCSTLQLTWGRGSLLVAVREPANVRSTPQLWWAEMPGSRARMCHSGHSTLRWTWAPGSLAGAGCRSPRSLSQSP